MRLLLDTHAVLWALNDPDELSRDTRAMIEAPENDVIVSSVSVWEVAIKQATGKLETPGSLLEALDEVSFASLSISHEHANLAGSLPLHHSDPFDRMLVAQAILEGLTLVTRDRTLGRYGAPIQAA